MYESLKAWCVFPFLLYHSNGVNKAGDKQYAVEEVKGYRVDDVVQIVDENNNLTLSKQRIYVDADIVCTLSDSVAFPEAPNLRLKIRKIGAYYDGNTGKKSITIIYL